MLTGVQIAARRRRTATGGHSATSELDATVSFVGFDQLAECIRRRGKEAD